MHNFERDIKFYSPFEPSLLNHANLRLLEIQAVLQTQVIVL